MSTEPSLPSSKFTDAEYRNLRRLALGLAVSLLILSASFGFFLLREILPLRQQINNMTEFLANHEVHTVPIMRAFNDELMGFARTNADFRLILGEIHSQYQCHGDATPGRRSSTNSVGTAAGTWALGRGFQRGTMAVPGPGTNGLRCS